MQSVGGRLRRPEYTGPNRCYPCTIANAVLAAALAALLSVASVPAALLFVAVAVAAIYFRGYLIPGTPTLTERYLPDRVLAWFEKRPREVPPVPTEAFEVEPILRAAAVVVDDRDGDDLVLDPEFEAEWRSRTAALMAAEERDAAELGAFLGADEGVTLTRTDDAYVARLDGRWLGAWESRPAFVADVAAAAALETRYEGWADLPTGRQSEVLGGLRLFLDRCPACGGAVELGTDVVRSCCRSHDVVAVTCRSCGARLFEADYGTETR